MRHGTIKELVFDFVKRSGHMVDKDALAKEVLKHFPNSRWKDTHWAWYKNQIKGPLKEEFEKYVNGKVALMPPAKKQAAHKRAETRAGCNDMHAIASVLEDAKNVARRYKILTGKPLGITGEVAEFIAATLLNLELTSARQSGYDAIRMRRGRKTKIQVKGRCLPQRANPGARIGSIQLNKEWDTVVLVLMNNDFEPCELFEADRTALTRALLEPGSKARNERGALGIAKFKSIARRVWPPDCPNGGDR